MPGEPTGMPGTLRPMACCRHMAFDRITANRRGMARAPLLGDAQPGPRVGIAGVVDPDLEPVRLQMPHPVLATTAIRVFPDFDPRFSGLGRHRNGQRCNRQRGGTSGHKTTSMQHDWLLVVGGACDHGPGGARGCRAQAVG